MNQNRVSLALEITMRKRSFEKSVIWTMIALITISEPLFLVQSARADEPFIRLSVDSEGILEAVKEVVVEHVGEIQREEYIKAAKQGGNGVRFVSFSTVEKNPTIATPKENEVVVMEVEQTFVSKICDNLGTGKMYNNVGTQYVPVVPGSAVGCPDSAAYIPGPDGSFIRCCGEGPAAVNSYGKQCDKLLNQNELQTGCTYARVGDRKYIECGSTTNNVVQTTFSQTHPNSWQQYDQYRHAGERQGIGQVLKYDRNGYPRIGPGGPYAESTYCQDCTLPIRPYVLTHSFQKLEGRYGPIQRILNVAVPRIRYRNGHIKTCNDAKIFLGRRQLYAIIAGTAASGGGGAGVVLFL